VLDTVRLAATQLGWRHVLLATTALPVAALALVAAAVAVMPTRRPRARSQGSTCSFSVRSAAFGIETKVAMVVFDLVLPAMLVAFGQSAWRRSQRKDPRSGPGTTCARCSWTTRASSPVRFQRRQRLP